MLSLFGSSFTLYTPSALSQRSSNSSDSCPKWQDASFSRDVFEIVSWVTRPLVGRCPGAFVAAAAARFVEKWVILIVCRAPCDLRFGLAL
jgi:hypothetical protein